MLSLLRYAWLDLTHDWARTLFSVAGMAVLVFSYQILGALSATFAEFSTPPAATRNLVVIQSDAIDHHDAILDPAALQAARDLGPDWVERVSPVMFRRVRVGDHLVQLRASPLADLQVLSQLTLVEGHWPAAPDEIAAGEGTARANGWNLGDRLRVYGSDFRISAIFRSPGTLFASIWMPLDAAERLYGATPATRPWSSRPLLARTWKPCAAGCKPIPACRATRSSSRTATPSATTRSPRTLPP